MEITMLMGMIWGLLGCSDSYIIKFLTQQESLKDPKILGITGLGLGVYLGLRVNSQSNRELIRG